MSMIFFNVSWMNEYQGAAGDPPLDGGDYKEKHEVCNYVDVDGFCYGFVQQTKWGSINFKKMNVSEEEDRIEGITIVWIAKRPKFGSVIVGFFLDATLYRNMQFVENSEKHSENNVGQYYVSV
jgi:5-methylcytosine-specific restriction enzyme A